MVIVFTSVEHTKNFIETGVSFVLGPFRLVAKLSVECRIRHRITLSAIQTFVL